MNSDEIFAAMEQIAATPGKNDKVALVTNFAKDTEFRVVLRSTYNPLVTYGVRKFYFYEKHADGCFDQGTYEMLERLAKRELTGNAALESIHNQMGVLSDASAELFKRILLGDMRAGFDAETCNKAVKGLIPVFPYMRCSTTKKVTLDAEFFQDGAYVQEKADGLFLNLDHEDTGIVRLTTRAGTEYPMEAYKEFADAVRATLNPGTQTHGEMVVLRDGKILPRQDGNGVLTHVASGGRFEDNEQPMFLAWDQIPLSAVVPKGKFMAPYKMRLQQLTGQMLINETSYLALIETVPVNSMAEAWAFYKKKLKEGKEGAVVKKAMAIWRDGTSTEQVKLKLEAPFEARVKGFKLGNGKNAGKISSLQCSSECGLLKFDVSCRGDKMIDEVTADPDSWLDAIVECKGNSIMEPGDSNPLHSIFLPIFNERRYDKTEADTLERIREQFQAAMEAA